MNHLLIHILKLIYVSITYRFDKTLNFLLDGYEFDSWKKFFEYTKQQESKTKIKDILTPFICFPLLDEKRIKSAGGTKDKKAAAGKAERGKVSIS